jgi:hypothetical protein
MRDQNVIVRSHSKEKFTKRFLGDCMMHLGRQIRRIILKYVVSASDRSIARSIYICPLLKEALEYLVPLVQGVHIDALDVFRDHLQAFF